MNRRCNLYSGVFILLLVLSGCSSVKRDAVYTPTNDRAFVLLTADSKPGSTLSGAYGTAIFLFRQVDLENSKFLNSGFRVAFAKSSFDSDELREPKSIQTTYRFAGTEAEEGDYALISRYDSNGQTRKQTCYSLGTTVFRIRKGHINILSVNSKLSERISGGRTVLPIAKKILTGYPGMTAPLSWSHPVGAINYSTDGRKFYENSCLKGDSLNVIRRATDE